MAPLPTNDIPFRDAIAVWARIAALSFGGPAGQIALMHRILVEEKRWIGDDRFLHALNYCMLLPGPEAQQLATYIGWLLHKTKGGLVAGGLFVLPGFIAILALSFVYVLFGTVPVVEGLFFGLKAAVLGIVLQALIRLGSRTLRNRARWAVAAASFAAIFIFAVPFPAVVLGAALIGFAAAGLQSRAFTFSPHGHSGAPVVEDRFSALGDGLPAHARPNVAWSLRIGSAFLLLWLAPVAALLLTLGPDALFTRIALFFSEMAMVTFGGAYAVLAFVAQRAVEGYGWLTASEMIDGLAMAETTPGPLIMVTQFVGFLGAYRDPGALHPLAAATLASVLTTWVTFMPCFLWIFLGAPFIERLRGNRALAGALTAITAAVVGVIANLALWFALHAIFGSVVGSGVFALSIPVWSTLNVAALVLTAAAIAALFRFDLPVPLMLLGAALLGAALTLAGLS